MINQTALRHPRTQWEIEAALWRAIDQGHAIACSAAGGEIVTVGYDRTQVPAFSFWRGGMDVSGEFREVLRKTVAYPGCIRYNSSSRIIGGGYER